MLEKKELTFCQKQALKILEGSGNVFVTGIAGTGKSYLTQRYMEKIDQKFNPIVASTGAAAILVGGRTFHSFFGLGIMQGGYKETVARALKNKRLAKRIEDAESVIIDEISMLSGETLRVAEEICRSIRGSDCPWGGIRIISVGDFAQLPPISRYNKEPDWAFTNEVWERSNFLPVNLKTVVRTNEEDFLEILNFVRNGIVNQKVEDFLNSKLVTADFDFDITKLFPLRKSVEKINLQKLEELKGKTYLFNTQYEARDEKYLEAIKKNAPISEQIKLKKGALVMIRKNDPEGFYGNGSLGHIDKLDEEFLKIKLLSGITVVVEKTTFSLLDAEGKEVAFASNFPVNLAYAATIHKAQGMTIDAAVIDLRGLWEPGQSYVALSRVKSSKNLYLLGWGADSIISSPRIAAFYKCL